MKRIYSLLVENRAGVLMKVAGLFTRRNFNINSLVVGETKDRDISCMTIVSNGDEHTIEQIEKQLNKKLDIIKVKTFSSGSAINRELMLLKVDMSKSMMLIQICDTSERVELFLEMFRSVSIVEVARTGVVALQKCKESEGKPV